jgi:hypothetical protein
MVAVNGTEKGVVTEDRRITGRRVWRKTERMCAN